MKIIKHGDLVVFTCDTCGCVFSEISGKCYSSFGSDGAHYSMLCPDCNNICWTTDELQSQQKVEKKEPVSFSLHECPYCHKTFQEMNIKNHDPQIVMEGVAKMVDVLNGSKGFEDARNECRCKEE